MFKVVGDTHVAGFRDGNKEWFLSCVGHATTDLSDFPWTPWNREGSRVIWDELIENGYKE